VVRADKEAAPCAGVARPPLITHIVKTSLGHVDLAWQVADAKNIYAAAEGGVFNVRVSLKLERPVADADLPERVDVVTAVRMKQRKSFVLAAADADARWSFDATQVYQAPTYSEAEAALRVGAVSQNEIEIECVNVMAHLAAYKNCHDKLAASLLLKASDLFEATQGVPMKSTGNVLVPVAALP
jgi:hypothetical protein